MSVTPDIPGSSRCVVIIAAVAIELEILRTSLNAALVTQDPYPVYAGRCGGNDVILVLGGLGKINAAAATAAAIERYRPSLLINTGCAGAFVGAGIPVCGIAVATEEVAADEGILTLDGWQGLETFGIPAVEAQGIHCFNTIPLTSERVAAVLTVAAGSNIQIVAGPFATVSTCSGTLERGNELRQRFGVICESMEGAAVAQVALRYGIDCVEIRGVSNLVEDRDMSRWNIRGSVAEAQRFVLHYLNTLGET